MEESQLGRIIKTIAIFGNGVVLVDSLKDSPVITDRRTHAMSREYGRVTSLATQNGT